MRRGTSLALIGGALLGGLAAAYFLVRSPRDNRPADAGIGPAAVLEPADARAEDELVAPAAEPKPVAAQPLPNTTQRSALDASGDQAIDLSKALWIEGVVLLPPGTPEDETLRVVARSAGSVAESTPPGDAIGGLQQALSAEGDVLSPPARPGVLHEISKAPVSPEGRFRLPLPPEQGAVELSLDGRYLYLDRPVRVQPRAGDNAQIDARLEARLGGWITGRLRPPTDMTPAEAGLAGVRLRLEHVLKTIDAMTSSSSWKSSDQTRCDESGAFELRAVAAAEDYVLSADCEKLAPARMAEISIDPGQHREIELALLHGARISGRVVDEAGAPIAEAGVEAMAMGGGLFGMEGGRGSKRKVRTDSNGAFALSGVPPGKVRLIAEKDKYLPSLGKSFEVQDEHALEQVELKLESGTSLAGAVRWPDGVPAARAKVEVELDPGALSGMGAMSAWRGASGDTQSDENGEFRVAGLGKGPFVVRAEGSREASDGMKSAGIVRLKNVAAGTADLVLVLEPAMAVRGIVQDLAGAPLAKFEMRAELSTGAQPFRIGRGREISKEFESEDGAFELSGLEPGDWKISAKVKDYGESDEIPLELPAQAPASLVVVVKAGACVSGLVLTPEGAPIGGAKIELAQSGGPWSSIQGGEKGAPEAHSDEIGHYELRGLQPGRVSLVASSESHAPSTALELELEPGEQRANVLIALRKGGRITGEVFDKKGKPHVGRSVVANNATAGDAKYSTSDSQGTFEFAHVQPGNWQVIAMGGMDVMMDAVGSGDLDPAQLMNEMKFAMVEVKDGEEVHVVLGAPPENPIKINGHITAAKQGVKALVYFLAEGGKAMGSFNSASSDADGRFEIELEKPGNYTVSVQQMIDAFGRQNTIEFNETIPAAKEHDLALELPLGSISGHVYGPDNEPLAGARVSLSIDGPIHSGTMTGGQYNESQTDATGRYELVWLRKGAYTVAAGGSFLGGILGDTSPHGRQLRAGLQLAEGRALENVDFHLAGAGEIEGRVLDAQGKAMAGAAIFVRDAQGKITERFSMNVSDGGGRFRYSGLSEGDYTVSARAKDLASPESGPVRVRPGEKAQVELELSPGTILMISLVDADDKPAKASITVLDSAGRQVNGMLAMEDMMAALQQGYSPLEQRVGPLPPGNYKVTASAESGASTTKPVSLTGQPERWLKLKLKE